MAAIAALLIALPFALPWFVERAVSRKAMDYGLLVRTKAEFGYCWRNGPGVCGSVTARAIGTHWSVRTDFAASACEWMASVEIPETDFDENDAVVRRILALCPPLGVSNLVFSGSVALDARAERTFSKPVPVWSVKVPITGLSASAVTEDRLASVEELTVALGASGIADHYDILPMCLRVKSMCAAGMELSDLKAMVRATDKALVVSEASAGFCGGKLNLYSLYLNPKSLNTGFTLFLDNVETGKALGYLKEFRGEASGRLHGKVKVFVREGGRAVKLSDAFLYSTPGQVGKLRVRDAEEFADSLSMAGLDADTRGNIANALTDLDYDVLRLDLVRGSGDEARLTFRVAGSVQRGEVKVPVDFTINLNGELEQIVNTGLGYSAKMKGNGK